MAIYLDYAAATPVDPDVLAAMQPFWTENFHNPSALYGPSVQASKSLELARSDIAAILGAKSSEIVFTAGGTETNNLAIHGIMQQYPNNEIVISAIEHDSVREPASQHRCRTINVDDTGVVDPDQLRLSVTPETVLISVMYANNEIGTVQPIRELSRAIAEIRRGRQADGVKLPLYLHVDAAQAGNYLDMHVHRLGADLVTVNGGKLYGPKQTGALYVNSSVSLKPLVQGGGQERNLRSGTENVAGAAGLAAALKKSASMRKEESSRLRELQQLFYSELEKEFPDSVINGSKKHRLPNNVHVTLPGIDNERVLIALDMEGVYAAAGSACSAGSEEPSHVLAAIGRSGHEIRSSLRFSMGRQTTQNDVREAVSKLKRVLA